MKTRQIWALAAVVMMSVGSSALAEDSANKVSADQSRAKMLALPAGFKTAQGFAAVDAVKGAKLSTESAATAMVAHDTVRSRLSTH